MPEVTLQGPGGPGNLAHDIAGLIFRPDRTWPSETWITARCVEHRFRKPSLAVTFDVRGEDELVPCIAPSHLAEDRIDAIA